LSHERFASDVGCLETRGPGIFDRADGDAFILPQMVALLLPLVCDEFECLLPAAWLRLAIVRGVAAVRDLRADLVTSVRVPA
jgi:hypothetical protein